MYPKDGSDKLSTPDRNVVRKNTYTKDMAGVANPDLEKKAAAATATKEILKPEEKEKEEAEDEEGHKTDEEVLMAI